jgi:carboxylesterase
MKGAEPIFIDKKSKIGILMIHGFSSTPDEFKELSKYLADKGFTVFAPLLAGHGTKPHDLLKTTAFDWAKSVKEAYFKLKEKTEKVFLIGNSFGSDLLFWLIKELNNEPLGIISLGAPIYLRGHNFILLRLYTYGLIQKFYHKPVRLYKTDYIDMLDEVTYTKIPTKSVRQFLRFIGKEIKPILEKIKIPALVVHCDNDKVIHPESATYIYERLGSSLKRLYWFHSYCHTATEDDHREELFEKIFYFIKDTNKDSKIKDG